MRERIDPTKKGFQLVEMTLVQAIALQGAGFAKVHQCGNTPSKFQIRLTGAGRRWLNGNADRVE